MPSDPRVFAEDGQAGAIMAWAGTQIHRNKTLLGLCAMSVGGQRGSTWLPVPLDRALFPLGFDCFFTCDNRVAGLPRSTIVEAC